MSMELVLYKHEQGRGEGGEKGKDWLVNVIYSPSTSI